MLGNHHLAAHPLKTANMHGLIFPKKMGGPPISMIQNCLGKNLPQLDPVHLLSIESSWLVFQDGILFFHGLWKESSYLDVPQS